MAIDRREFLALGAAGGAAWLSGCGGRNTSETKPPAAAVSSQVTMTVRDGYAYVFRNNRTNLVIGAIDASGMTHPLLLTVDKGKVKGTAPLPLVQGRSNKYDFTGWHVELDLGSSATALTVPAESWPDPVVCPSGTLSAWNNLAWLPAASKIYRGSSMVKDWPAKLSSRLVVSQGTMRVLESAGPGMWEFKKGPTSPVLLRQPMSDGTEFSQTVAADTIVFKVFKKTDELPASGAKPDAEFVIEQDGGQITLGVDNGIPAGAPYAIGKPVPHFARYAALMQGGDPDILPYFEECSKGSGEGACPGDFCPYGRFEA